MAGELTGDVTQDLTPGTASGTPELTETSHEPRVPIRLVALKHGDTFIVADSNGDILGEGDGLFQNDTRILSRWRLTIGGKAPVLLSSSLSQDNVTFTTNLTNRPLPPLGGQSMKEGVIHIERKRLIFHERVYERITFTNFAREATRIPFTLEYEADFVDMFEVRGLTRPVRGEVLPVEHQGAWVKLSYCGLDGLLRETHLAFSQEPMVVNSRSATFMLDLPRNTERVFYAEIGLAPSVPDCVRFRAAAARAHFGMRSQRRRGARVSSKARLFNTWMDKSRADLALLTTQLSTGPYPYAGIPWFSTPFGRDAIITAMQMLWLDPSLARGVLNFLARHQADAHSPFRDAAPGKIMHETRRGEMAALQELPFGLYYGGVDTTPLFVMLAGAYAQRTGDLYFIDEIWPALEGAVGWIIEEGDSDGDGFIDYQRAADTGLANQGWKDSNDSVFHEDGSDPQGAIALVEVQGYCFAALTAMAELSERRNEFEKASRWQRAAERLRANVERHFWLEEKQFYALALDGTRRACAVRTSNAGHLLFAGLPTAARARSVIDQLLAVDFSTGWGVRTLPIGEARYNPMSYHNGSVWPHDSALCVAGMARYGERSGVVRMMGEMFDAAVRFDMRLPELFCGFQRAPGEGPVTYPVACLPQAWASGSIFMLLQACLGLRIDGYRGALHISRPRLPPDVDELVIRGLLVGHRQIDITFHRVGNGVVAYSDDFFNGTVPMHQHG
jgi:glycogen debranching enzyme